MPLFILRQLYKCLCCLDGIVHLVCSSLLLPLFQLQRLCQWALLWHVAHTLYCQTYSLTHPNDWVQVFQSRPWPQVYKIKHLGMEAASTNICERMGPSQELSESQCGTVIGCQLCNKSRREISSQFKIPQSTVSGIITVCKWLGTTAAQPWSDRPRIVGIVGSLFRSWAQLFNSSERNSSCSNIPRDFGRFHAPNFEGTVWGWLLPVTTWLCTPAHKTISMKTRMSEFGVGDLNWPAQSPGQIW